MRNNRCMNDLRAFDLNLLVTLDALLTEANVTRAAQRLHLSQSAVSGQLARLRQLFDDPLLLPADNGRGMTPTTRALDLAGPVRAALDQLAGIVRGQPAFDPATAQRTFQIAATVPSRLAALHADALDSFALPFESRGFSLYAAWHPRCHADPALAWLRDQIVHCAA